MGISITQLHFHNTTDREGGDFCPFLPALRNYWTASQNSNSVKKIEKMKIRKTLEIYGGNPNVTDLGLTMTSQVRSISKYLTFAMLGFVTNYSHIKWK